jgi:hypothetical protein
MEPATKDEIAVLTGAVQGLMVAMTIAITQTPDPKTTLALLQKASKQHEAFLLNQAMPDIALEHAQLTLAALIANLQTRVGVPRDQDI